MGSAGGARLAVAVAVVVLLGCGGCVAALERAAPLAGGGGSRASGSVLTTMHLRAKLERRLASLHVLVAVEGSGRWVMVAGEGVQHGCRCEGVPACRTLSEDGGTVVVRGLSCCWCNAGLLRPLGPGGVRVAAAAAAARCCSWSRHCCAARLSLKGTDTWWLCRWVSVANMWGVVLRQLKFELFNSAASAKLSRRLHARTCMSRLQ